MRQHIPAIVAGLLAGALPGGYAVFHKPAPTIVRPQTTIVSKVAPNQILPRENWWDNPELSRSERRQLAAQWGDLAQPEVDALTAALNKLPKVDVVIFCADDSLCGDMRDDLENAFESAHWKVVTQKPLIDDTVGIAASSEAIRNAINGATSGRLSVGIIAKNAQFEAIALGKKGAKR